MNDAAVKRMIKLAKTRGYVTLDELRSIPEMAGSRLLARGNRLSVLPLTEAEFDAVIRYADGH